MAYEDDGRKECVEREIAFGLGWTEKCERADEVVEWRRLDGLRRIIQERVGAIAGDHITVRVQGRVVGKMDGDCEFDEPFSGKAEGSILASSTRQSFGIDFCIPSIKFLVLPESMPPALSHTVIKNLVSLEGPTMKAVALLPWMSGSRMYDQEELGLGESIENEVLCNELSVAQPLGRDGFGGRL